ncbi:hypothetical protein MTO96_016759 [Rhipicephalus appendiculatus]
MQSQQLRVAQGWLAACCLGEQRAPVPGATRQSLEGVVRIANSMHFGAWRAPGSAPALNRVLLSRLGSTRLGCPRRLSECGEYGEWLGALIWRFSSECRHRDLLARVDISLLSGRCRVAPFSGDFVPALPLRCRGGWILEARFPCEPRDRRG